MDICTPHKRIRSFVRREGRLTPGQQRALDSLWRKYGLAVEQDIEFRQIFGRSAPLTLEIGFGNGESLAQMAAHQPGSDFIGVEVHRPGVGHLLMTLEERSLTNVRIFCHDAIEVLEHKIPDAALERVLLFFPDPWPKTKHHKRRLVQAPFISLIADKLKPGGLLHMATDWQPYAEHMLEVLHARDEFRPYLGVGGGVEYPGYRPATKFEARGRRLGHTVWDLLYQRTKRAD